MKCLITGVSRGIGRATLKELLGQGHDVWGISRTPPSDVPVDAGGSFHHLSGDLACEKSLSEMRQAVDSAGFIPDVVILNAAIEYEEGADRLSWAPMQNTLRTNVEGALFWVCHWMDQPPVPPMQFVAISSLQALRPDADCPAYSASKAALSLAFRSFRLRYAKGSTPFKVLYLGPVHTSIKPRFVQAPRGRGVAAPEEVARYLVRTVLGKPQCDFYYPWAMGIAARFGMWMPDTWFERWTRPLRR